MIHRGAFSSIASCLVFLLLASCTKPVVDQAKFQSLYRSAKSVLAAIETGVNYDEFSRLLKSLATEVSVSADLASTDSERACAYSYEWALRSYQDSLNVWYQKNVGTVSASDADEAMQRYWALARGYVRQGEDYYLGKRKF